MAQLVEAKPISSTELAVFVEGKYDPTKISVDSSSPKPLLIFTPSDEGTYPVFFFFHGFYLHNYFYTDLLHFMSSHGFIIVAPQLCNIVPPSGEEELESAAKVADWLPTGLLTILPQNVEPNLEKLALVGHSRGGKTAFSLALKQATTTQTFSALVGIDPVAGTAPGSELMPKVLTHRPCSLNLAMPVAVIGTALGPESKTCIPLPCAPEGVNHVEFFDDCMPPKAHFVAKNYGHMDVLNDNLPGIVGKFANCTCVNGKGPRDLMRRAVGGIVVAFLNYYFHGEEQDFLTIVDQPSVTPVELDDVEFDTKPCTV